MSPEGKVKIRAFLEGGGRCVPRAPGMQMHVPSTYIEGETSRDDADGTINAIGVVAVILLVDE